MISFHLFRRHVGLALLAGTLATPVLVFGAVVGLGYEPANVLEDGPRLPPERHDSAHDLVAAAVVGCAQAQGLWIAHDGGGRCYPTESVGVVPAVRRGR